MKRLTIRLSKVRAQDALPYMASFTNYDSEKALKSIMTILLPKIEKQEVHFFSEQNLRDIYSIFLALRNDLSSKRMLDCLNVLYENTSGFRDRREFIHIYKQALELYE